MADRVVIVGADRSAWSLRSVWRLMEFHPSSWKARRPRRGIHDAVNLAAKLVRIFRGDSEDLLDLYTRQRRPVAVGEILAQSHQNRIRMQLWDVEQRRQVMMQMREIAADPERTKQMLLRTSMIDGLRKAAGVC